MTPIESLLDTETAAVIESTAQKVTEVPTPLDMAVVAPMATAMVADTGIRLDTAAMVPIDMAAMVLTPSIDVLNREA